MSIKDNIVTGRLPTSAASNILKGYAAPGNARVVELLQDAGMMVAGKTNMDEFGMGSHTMNSAFGPAKNGKGPAAISVGGSSGGAALSVAANACDYAIGTDTGGSVRLPAAYLNLVGFKPSYGRISRNGVIPYANSLDTVGIIAKGCLDVLLLFITLDEPDANDPTCLTLASRKRIQDMKTRRRKLGDDKPLRMIVRSDYRHQFRINHYQTESRKHNMSIFSRRAPARRRVGVPQEYNVAEMLPAVRDAWNRALVTLEQQGHEVVPVTLPATQQALSAYYVLAPAEASSNLAKYDGIRYGEARDELLDPEEGVLYSEHRGVHFGHEVKRRILLGSYTLSAGARDNYFIQAQKVRRLVQRDFNMVFRMPHPLLDEVEFVSNGVDYIVCPTAPTFPPSFEALLKASPVESYVNDIFTVPASLAGLPAISIPAPADPDTLKTTPEKAVGIQVIGQYGDDVGVIQFARHMLALTQGVEHRDHLVPSYPSRRDEVHWK